MTPAHEDTTERPTQAQDKEQDDRSNNPKKKPRIEPTQTRQKQIGLYFTSKVPAAITRFGLHESTYVPNAHVMVYILNEMDRLMLGNQKFTSVDHSWNPALTRLYMCTVFAIQTARCQLARSFGDSRIKASIKLVLDELDLGSIMIPGPVVPIIHSLVNSKPLNSILGQVGPCLPDFSEITEDNLSLKAPDVFHFPNLMVMRVVANHIATSGSPNPFSNVARLTSRGNATNTRMLGHNVPARHYACLNPATMSRLEEGPKRGSSPYWKAHANTHRKVQPPLPNASPYDAQDFLGFGENFHWFTELSKAMQYYCTHWKESKTLKDIPVNNGSTSLLIARPDPFQSESLEAMYEYGSPTTFDCSLLSKDDVIDEVAKEFQLYSQTLVEYEHGKFGSQQPYSEVEEPNPAYIAQQQDASPDSASDIPQTIVQRVANPPDPVNTFNGLYFTREPKYQTTKTIQITANQYTPTILSLYESK
jgi:hypothetical protein